MTTGPQPHEPDRTETFGIRPYLRGLVPVPAGHGPWAADHTTPVALRPFVMTAGRVDDGDPRLGFETQVTAMPGVRPKHLPPEAGAIVAICAEPISVAEISARLHLHLGVTKVLVGDLHTAGYLMVHAVGTQAPDPDTILRVIDGLRSIF